ncbi:carboxylate/amino acid/amine transporter [Pragia fontium]|uniref:Membrane protein n=1 Tax=Pragia fontium TaxID=82985 RepID=A0ABQ5LNL2_9GAMM|nr:carboxylate/amino acid/amine transporter [Pragia fontium]AKJ43630.1 membrane protein [Pragia fontium]GKX64497.1 membrane protein [Pragia fontium]VEJ57018.1 carboxylate/amino acid/amine transporter [Pragia fontium]
MPLLVTTTILWAFSFSLIGVYLSGQVDTWFAVFIRIALAFLVFLPFLRIRGVSLKQALLFMLVGAFQLGIMYLFYYQSFLYLSVPEILLFTIMTPIYVTLIYDLLAGNRLRVGYLLSALLAVIGAAVIRYNQLSAQFWLGLFFVQGANICFAIGQVGYKRLMEVYPMPQRSAFSWFYLGALVVASIAWLLFGDISKMPTTGLQWGILVWLGIGASGLGYFMWNYGATQVDAGTLAIMNNALIPAGLLVNFAIWQHDVDWLRLVIGGGIIMLSLLVHKRWVVPHVKTVHKSA